MFNPSRRFFTTALASAPLVAATAPLAFASHTAAESRSERALPPVAQIQIGRFQVTALTDGYGDMPASFFTGREPAQVEAAAKKSGHLHDGSLRLSFNQFLIRDGQNTVLVDAGPAGNIGETGRLPAALAHLGVQPSDIDAVILTHLHFDHMAGLLRGGTAQFADAEVYADRRDVIHFTDPAKKAAAPDFLRSSFEMAEQLVALYPRLQQIDGEPEITKGISIVDLTGHTPGHIGVRIEDEGQSLLLVSDMLFHPAVHPLGADVGFVFEQDLAASRLMRERFFPMAAAEGALIGATHMPFPGLGRIVDDRGQLTWAAADWAHGF